MATSRMGPTSPVNQRIITMSERKEILTQKGAMLARSFEGFRIFGDKNVIKGDVAAAAAAAAIVAEAASSGEESQRRE